MSEILYTANLTGSLKLSAEGQWYHNGVLFQNPKLSQLFHNSIVWDKEKNQFFVRIGQQQASFDYEDTVYFVKFLDDTQSPWKLTLMDESIEDLIPSSLQSGKDNQIYCAVKGAQRAKLLRNTHQTLMNYALDDEHLKIDGHIIRL